jgi:hypothetical protein
MYKYLLLSYDYEERFRSVNVTMSGGRAHVQYAS